MDLKRQAQVLGVSSEAVFDLFLYLLQNTARGGELSQVFLHGTFRRCVYRAVWESDNWINLQ